MLTNLLQIPAVGLLEKRDLCWFWEYYLVSHGAKMLFIPASDGEVWSVDVKTKNQP